MLNHRVTHLLPPRVCVCVFVSISGRFSTGGLLVQQTGWPVQSPLLLLPFWSETRFHPITSIPQKACEAPAIQTQISVIQSARPHPLVSGAQLVERLPGRQGDVWKAAEAGHVTDTHPSPPRIHRYVQLRFLLDTWCITWSDLMCTEAEAVLIGIRSRMTDWAKHQVSDLSSGSGFTF